MMRAGSLDRVIRIERFEETPDDAGGFTQGWTEVITLRAQKVEASTEEFLRDYGTTSEHLVIFRTRYVDGITLADRIVYDGHAHDLKETKEIGRRRGLELRTVSTGEEVP